LGGGGCLTTTEHCSAVALCRASTAILVDNEGFWDQDEVDRAEVRGDVARPLQVSLEKIWTADRRRAHLARALDLFALGSAAWNLRQTFEEVVRELGPQSEAWIAARGRTAADEPTNGLSGNGKPRTRTMERNHRSLAGAACAHGR
jgi:hypothetical protein